MIQLKVKGESLYWPQVDEDGHDMILLHIYPAGDCDRIDWPNPNLKHLSGCLFDGREMGYIPANDSAVLLPDGSVFEIESHLSELEAEESLYRPY